MDTSVIDPKDTTKLYNFKGIPRYGRKNAFGITTFEQMDLAGGTYLEVETDIDYPILFDVQLEGRYPSGDEWAAWNGNPCRLSRW
jgi:hypothetical protein